MRTLPLVVISSTWTDLIRERAAAKDICDKLGMVPRMMESQTASPLDKVDDSLAMVDSADVYVGIVGYRYGDLVPGTDKSLTELEYDRAIERRIGCLMFLKKSKRSRLAAADVSPDASRVERFRQRLMARNRCEWFATPADLRAELAAALYRYRVEIFDAPIASPLARTDEVAAARMLALSEVAARVFALRVADWFHQRIEELETAAGSRELRINDRRSHEHVLAHLAKAEDNYPGGVYTLDSTGVVLCHSTPRYPGMNIVNYNAGHREYFRECSSRLSPVVCNSFRSANRAEEILVLAVPRRDDTGAFIGILDAVIDVSSAPFGRMAEAVRAEVFPAQSAGHRATLLLLDQHSVVLGSNEQQLIGKNLGGHAVITDLDSSRGVPDGPTSSGHGVARHVDGTPFIVVAFWSP